jgi:hypothetical protein
VAVLLRAVEAYHESAVALDHLLTDQDPVRQWLRLGFAVLAVERELSHLGFGPDPPPSTSCPADLDVAGFAEWMRQLRRGDDGWGQRVGGYWVECCRVPGGTRDRAVENADMEEAWARPDLKGVSAVLARLRLYVSGWRAALRQAGAAAAAAAAAADEPEGCPGGESGARATSEYDQQPALPVPVGPETAEAADQPPQPHNGIGLVGEIWHIQYVQSGEVEDGEFGDRSGSPLRRLARLLAEPDRRFGAMDFNPPPPDQLPPIAGSATLPNYGRDDRSDDQTIRAAEKEMREVLEELKEAKEDHDTEEAARLQKKLDSLTEHHQGEKATRKRYHKKKCGPLSPAERADQAVRVGFRSLQKRLHEGNMPKLSGHLHKHLHNSGGKWWYSPPPGTSPWHVTLPPSPVFRNPFCNGRLPVAG